MSASPSRTAKCPACEGDVGPDAAAKPFCSDRCKWVDLGRWLRGDYVIPAEDAVDFGPEMVEGAPPSDAVGGDAEYD